jgi:hypothetical protein
LLGDEQSRGQPPHGVRLPSLLLHIPVVLHVAAPEQQRTTPDESHVAEQFFATHWMSPAQAPPVPQSTVAFCPST